MIDIEIPCAQIGHGLAHPAVSYGSMSLLIDGPASFAALGTAVRSAQTRIYIESYELDDTAGGAFADLLLAARRRDVEVNLIYDAWGARYTEPTWFNRLRQGGIKVLEYNPLRPNAQVSIKVNARDHCKFLCVDGRIAITGEVNVSRIHRNAPGHVTVDPNDETWRDTDVRIKGPVVAQGLRMRFRSPAGS